MSRLAHITNSMKTLLSINELAGIKINKQYQRVILAPQTLNQADLTDLSERVRLIFPISEMFRGELSRKGIMFFVKTKVSILRPPQTTQEVEVNSLFLTAFLNAVASVNVRDLGIAAQPMPLIGDDIRYGAYNGYFEVVFGGIVSGPQVLETLRRVFEAGYKQARANISKAAEISATQVLPIF